MPPKITKEEYAKLKKKREEEQKARAKAAEAAAGSTEDTSEMKDSGGFIATDVIREHLGESAEIGASIASDTRRWHGEPDDESKDNAELQAKELAKSALLASSAFAKGSPSKSSPKKGTNNSSSEEKEALVEESAPPMGRRTRSSSVGEAEAGATTEAVVDEAPKTRGRSRSRRGAAATEEPAIVTKMSMDSANNNEETEPVTETVKRGRGRPRKSTSPPSQEKATNESIESNEMQREEKEDAMELVEENKTEVVAEVEEVAESTSVATTSSLLPPPLSPAGINTATAARVVSTLDSLPTFLSNIQPHATTATRLSLSNTMVMNLPMPEEDLAEMQQKLHDLESMHMSTLKDHDAQKVELESLRNQFSQREAIIEELREKQTVNQSQLSDAELELRAKNQSIKDLHQQELDLRDRQSRLSEECDRLRDDLRSKTDEVDGLHISLKDKDIALSEATSKVLPLEYEIIKLKKEKETFERQSSSLETDLNSRVEEHSQLRTENNRLKNELATIKGSFDTEREDLEDRLKTIQASQDTQNNKVDNLLSQLTDLRVEKTTMENALNRTIDNTKRMHDMYKKKFEEASESLEECQRTMATMKEVHAAKVGTLMAQLSSHNQVVNTENEEIVSLKSQLESLYQELEEVKANRDSVPVVEETQHSSSKQRSHPPSFEFDAGMTMTDMYSRVVDAEKQLSQERTKRNEAEQYLNRILKDMEARAPQLLSQKKDFHRVLEHNSLLTQKVDELTEKELQLQEDLKVEKETARLAGENAAALTQHNKDLSSQIQHLLKQELGTGTRRKSAPKSPFSPSDMSQGEPISDHLLTFGSVQELQAKNEQFVRVVRKLEGDYTKLVQIMNEKGFSADGSMSDKRVNEMDMALSELSSMKAARERTEEMVLGLIHQRDMYKAMLEEQSADVTMGSPGAMLGSPSGGMTVAKTPGTTGTRSRRSSRGGGATTPGSGFIQKQHDMQWRVAELEDEKNLLQSRVEKFEESENSLNEALDDAKTQISTLRLEKAHASGELNFQKERANRLEESIKSSQEDTNIAIQRKVELQRTLLEQQKESRAKDERILEINDELRNVKTDLRKAQIDANAAREAEERMSKQLQDAREDAKKQYALGDTVRRVEAGLSSRLEEDKAKLNLEKEVMYKTIENLRKQLSEKALADDQRLKVTEDESIALRSRVDELTKETHGLKEDLARTSGNLKAAQDRCNILERQYTNSQDRLNAVHDKQQLGAVITRENAEKDLAIEKLTAKINQLTSELDSAQEHSEQYKKMSKSLEATLGELTDRQNDVKDKYITEINELSESLSKREEDLSQANTKTREMLSDIQKSRDELVTLRGEMEELKRQHAYEISTKTQEATDAQKHEGELKQDLLKFQQQSKIDRRNYEHEHEINTRTQEERRELEKELEKIRNKLSVVEAREADLSAELIEKQTVVNDNSNKLDTVRSEYEEKLGRLKEQNDLLHKEMDSLSNKLKRHEQIAAEGTDAASSVGATQETQELQQSISVLREVVRSMKTDAEILEGRLSVSDAENGRLELSVRSLQRALDTARSAVRVDQSSNGNDTTTNSAAIADKQKIDQYESQLKVINESNLYLQSENESLAKKLEGKDKEAKKLKDSVKPLEEKLRSLEAEKDSSNKAAKSFSDDANYWKDKYTKYVHQGSGIDEEEYLNMQKKVTELTEKHESDRKQMEVLQGELETTRGEQSKALKAMKFRYDKEGKDKSKSMGVEVERLQQSVTQLEADLEQQKQLSEMNEKTANNRKTMLQTMKAKYTDAQKKWDSERSEKDKLLKASEDKVAELTEALKEQAVQLTANNVMDSSSVSVAEITTTKTTTVAAEARAHSSSFKALEPTRSTTSETKEVEDTEVEKPLTRAQKMQKRKEAAAQRKKDAAAAKAGKTAADKGGDSSESATKVPATGTVSIRRKRSAAEAVETASEETCTSKDKEEEEEKEDAQEPAVAVAAVKTIAEESSESKMDTNTPPETEIVVAADTLNVAAEEEETFETTTTVTTEDHTVPAVMEEKEQEVESIEEAESTAGYISTDAPREYLGEETEVGDSIASDAGKWHDDAVEEAKEEAPSNKQQKDKKSDEAPRASTGDEMDLLETAPATTEETTEAVVEKTVAAPAPAPAPLPVSATSAIDAMAQMKANLLKHKMAKQEAEAKKRSLTAASALPKDSEEKEDQVGNKRLKLSSGAATTVTSYVDEVQPEAAATDSMDTNNTGPFGRASSSSASLEIASDAGSTGDASGPTTPSLLNTAANPFFPSKASFTNPTIKPGGFTNPFTTAGAKTTGVPLKLGADIGGKKSIFGKKGGNDGSATANTPSPTPFGSLFKKDTQKASTAETEEAQSFGGVKASFGSSSQGSGVFGGFGGKATSQVSPASHP